MRVIEPRFTSIKIQQRKRARRKRLALSFTVLLFTIFGGFGIVSYLEKKSDQSQDSANGMRSSSSAQTAGEQDEGPQLLSADQFQEFYESLVFPNTQPLEIPPIITGNIQADERIRQIAESRGYVLRSVPVFPIVKSNEPNLNQDDLLQPKAFAAWKELKTQAKNENYNLILTSAYRSVDRQRELFLQRLGPAATQTDQIARGALDNEIVRVLRFASPPGYSRHHTGYTIDLRCGGYDQAFEFTPCFEWLNKDNYTNAKASGWIPSYPDGVDDQGPEPEPWEYVWVGKEQL